MLLISAVVVAVLAWVVVALRRELDALATTDCDGSSGVSAEVITIEIHNHVELAAERTGLARPLHRVAPGLIRSLVHKETVKLLRRELADQGVDADVRLRRLPLTDQIRPSATDQHDELEVSSR